MTPLSRSLLVAALALGAANVARAQQAPARQPPPSATKRDSVALLPPPYRPAPPVRTAAPAATTAAARPATSAAPLAVSRPSRLPPDSVAPRAPRTDSAPANATGRCKDGTWLTAPVSASACAAHRGVLFAAPRAAAAPRPLAAAPAPEPAAAPAPVTSAAAPPSGATMRCKDGTYLSGAPSADRCAARGGLAAILPSRASAPPAPRQH